MYGKCSFFIKSFTNKKRTEELCELNWFCLLCVVNWCDEIYGFPFGHFLNQNRLNLIWCLKHQTIRIRGSINKITNTLYLPNISIFESQKKTTTNQLKIICSKYFDVDFIFFGNQFKAYKCLLLSWKVKCLAKKLNNRIELITKNETDSITCELISTQKTTRIIFPCVFQPNYLFFTCFW